MILSKLEGIKNEGSVGPSSKTKESSKTKPSLSRAKSPKSPKPDFKSLQNPSTTPPNSELIGYFEDYRKNVVGGALYIESLQTLRTIIKNVVDNPNEEKYRKIKATNKMFLEKIRPYDAALKILKYVLLPLIYD